MEFGKEKKIPVARKCPSHPAHNFSNGPSVASAPSTRPSTFTNELYLLPKEPEHSGYKIATLSLNPKPVPN